MTKTISISAMVGYYASVLYLPNGDLAIVAGHNLMQEWENFQQTGKNLNQIGKAVPEDERTPRQMPLSALTSGCLTVLGLLYDIDEIGRMAGGIQVLSDHDLADIGALTSAPVLALGVERDDDYKVTNVTDTWWFPNYQVEDELETLLTKGVVVFTRAPQE